MLNRIKGFVDFVKEYKSSRKLIHYGIHHRKPEATINLTVIDKSTGIALRLIKVLIIETGEETLTDVDGLSKLEFKKAGITAILGCGFDPGVTSIYTAYAAKHHFDEIQYLDIVDCNAGDHGKPFATNFNPEINIREVTQMGKYWDNGKWIMTNPH